MSDLQDLVNRTNRARLQVKQLTAQRAALVCEHEQALRMLGYFRDDPMTYLADGTSVHDKINADLFKPCWKGRRERPDMGDHLGDPVYVPFGDVRDSGWCDPCRKREQLRKPLQTARAQFGALRAAIWRKAQP